MSTLTAEMATGSADTPQPEPLLIGTEQNSEPNKLSADDNTQTIAAHPSNTVGPVLHLEVMIEGVPVQAVVDFRAQSSIVYIGYDRIGIIY